jgi:hypothetical protein
MMCGPLPRTYSAVFATKFWKPVVRKNSGQAAVAIP